MAANGTNKRERVALALASGLSIRRAAKRCHVGTRTIFRWLENQDFRHRVHEVRTQLFHRAVGQMSRISSKAVSVLNRLLDSESERIRLTSARVILEVGIKARENLELAQRLDELEKCLNAHGE